MEEQLDQETLLSLIKEKTKEANILSRKVSKLEERYVAKHRENTEILSEREILLSFLQGVLDEKLPTEVGKISGEDLESKWSSKQEDQSRLIRSLTASASEASQKYRSEIQSLKEDLQFKEQQMSDYKDLEEDCAGLRKQCEESKGEIEYLEKQMDSLRVENARLRAQHEHLSTMKTNILIAKMDETSEDKGSEVAKLQKQLVDAQSRISMLETDIEERKIYSDRHEDGHAQIEELLLIKNKFEHSISELKKELNSVREEFREHRQRAQKIVLEKEQTIEKLKKSSAKDENFALKQRLSELESRQNNGNISMEYIKNIVIKFMEYMYTGNSKEAATVSTAIFTVLQFSPDEIELINTAKKSTGIYNSFRNFFSTKSPGVGVSQNTLRLNETRRRITLESSMN